MRVKAKILASKLIKLRDLGPEGAVAGSDERVLAGVPAQEMRRVHVFGVGAAAGPNFVEQEATRRVHGAMQIEGEAAVFSSGGADQRAQLSFQKRFLAFARAQHDDERDGVFG